MTVQRSDDATYHAYMQRNAAAMYPDSVSEFRATWTDDSVVPWIQDVVNALTDAQIATLADSLRGTFLKTPSKVMEIWVLAQHTAGLR
jgi:hypothetical protein